VSLRDAAFSRPRLTLAWHRIGTGTNWQHKRYFRHLYPAYSTALDENLADLSRRLRYGSYQPQKPTRVYLPKASGLQRPITLLCIEDQIVLQSMADLVAARMEPRRRQVELKSVYSNVVSSRTDSIFFLRDWRRTYEAFTRKLRFLYRRGYSWMA
jgi:hypothetical protein